MSEEFTMGGGWGNTINWTDVSAFHKPFTDQNRWMLNRHTLVLQSWKFCPICGSTRP